MGDHEVTNIVDTKRPFSKRYTEEDDCRLLSAVELFGIDQFKFIAKKFKIKRVMSEWTHRNRFRFLKERGVIDYSMEGELTVVNEEFKTIYENFKATDEELKRISIEKAEDKLEKKDGLYVMPKTNTKKLHKAQIFNDEEDCKLLAGVSLFGVDGVRAIMLLFTFRDSLLGVHLQNRLKCLQEAKTVEIDDRNVYVINKSLKQKYRDFKKTNPRYTSVKVVTLEDTEDETENEPSSGNSSLQELPPVEPMEQQPTEVVVKTTPNLEETQATDEPALSPSDKEKSVAKSLLPDESAVGVTDNDIIDVNSLLPDESAVRVEDNDIIDVNALLPDESAVGVEDNDIIDVNSLLPDKSAVGVTDNNVMDLKSSLRNELTDSETDIIMTKSKFLVLDESNDSETRSLSSSPEILLVQPADTEDKSDDAGHDITLKRRISNSESSDPKPVPRKRRKKVSLKQLFKEIQDNGIEGLEIKSTDSETANDRVNANSQSLTSSPEMLLVQTADTDDKSDDAGHDVTLKRRISNSK